MNDFFELFAKFNAEFMGLLFFLMLSFFSAVLFYFIYFRKSFSSKIHEIPQSMINSLDPEMSSPRSFDQLTGSTDATLKKEIERLNNEILGYKKQLESRGEEPSVGDTELLRLNEELKSEIKQNEEKIKKLKSNSTGDNNSKRLLAENEELELRLREYEIIEKDLANLKQIQDENTRLKELIRGKDLEAEFLQEFPQINSSQEENVSHEKTQSKVSGVDEEVVSSDEKALVENLVKEDESGSEETVENIDSNNEVDQASSESTDSESSGVNSGPSNEAKDEELSEPVQVKSEKEEDDLGEVVEIEKDGKEKSADELLSEFEKMLG